MLGEAFGRADKDVDWKNKVLRYGGADGIVPFGPVVQGFEDDEEVDVAVGAGVAAGVAAEEDDLLRVEFLGDQLGNGLDCGLVDGDFGHVREAFVTRVSTCWRQIDQGSYAF